MLVKKLHLLFCLLMLLAARAGRHFYLKDSFEYMSRSAQKYIFVRVGVGEICCVTSNEPSGLSGVAVNYKVKCLSRFLCRGTCIYMLTSAREVQSELKNMDLKVCWSATCIYTHLHIQEYRINQQCTHTNTYNFQPHFMEQ